MKPLSTIAGGTAIIVNVQKNQEKNYALLSKDIERIDELRQKDNEISARDIKLAIALESKENAERILKLAHHADFNKYMEAVANTEKSQGKEGN
jgi:hypothetical protein